MAGWGMGMARRAGLSRWLVAIGLVAGCARDPAGAGDAGVLADLAGEIDVDSAVEAEIDALVDEDGVGEVVEDLVDVVDVDVPDDAVGADAELGSDAVLDSIADVDANVVAEVVADADVDAGVADVGSGTDAVSDAVDASSDATKAVPNWKGVPYSACSAGPYAPVAAADPTCKASCPAPYPCTCGTCAWLPTPKMTIPRYYHSAVWTGKYVVVVGSYHPGVPSLAAKMTGERWDPKSNKGFEPIPIEQPAVADASISVSLAWTGKDVLMFPFDYKFQWLRYDPESNMAKPIAFSPEVTIIYPPSVVAGKVLFRGTPLSMYDPASETGQVLKIPADLIEPGAVVWGSKCAAADGDYFYVYDPAVTDGKGKKWKNGLPVEAGAILRLHVPTMQWEVLGLAANPKMRCPTAPSDIRVAVSGDQLVVAGELMDAGIGMWLTAGSIQNLVWSDVAKFAGALGKAPAPLKSVGQAILVPGNVNILPGSPGGFSQFVGNFVFPAPLAYDLTAGVWHQLPPWGQPTDGRSQTAVVVTDDELLVLGGWNGPSWANFVHQDGFRFPLKALPAAGYP